MANTRKALRDIGASNMNEDALVQKGIETIRDLVKDALRSKGIEDAVAFELKLTNGETITINSESNPNLNRPASEVAPDGLNVRQSARAGLTRVFRVVD
jgi:hypothetical protein